MSAWSVVLTSGGTSVTIDENGKFSFDAKKQLTENGKVEFVDVSLLIEGDVVESTPSDVQTAVDALYDMVATNHQVASVSVKLDGTEKWAFQAANCFGSPHVVRFRTLDTDGAGHSRWRYQLEVFARVRGNQFSGVYELTASVLTREEYGKVVRKVWRATCKSTTASSALQTVMKFKPGISSDQLAVSEIEKFSQPAQATGLWVWEATRSAKVLRYEEDIYYTPTKARYLAEEMPGNDEPPVAVKGRVPAGTARVVGTVIGLTKEGLEVPKPHWTHNGKTIIRQESEEKTYDSTFNQRDRLWRLRYEESWLFFLDKVPPPRHVGHNDETVTLPPADGLAGSL